VQKNEPGCAGYFLTIPKYINKEFGVYDIFRTGVPDMFSVLDEIPENTRWW
jgi:hypothetical protein